MKLKSTGQVVVPTGLVHQAEAGKYIGVLVPTPRKDRIRPQNHVQYIRETKLEKDDA